MEQGKYEEAGPILERSLAIREKSFGPNRPDVATALHTRAKLLMIQDKYTEAIPPLERALSIRTNKLGGDRQDTVNTRVLPALVREKVGSTEIGEPLAVAETR